MFKIGKNREEKVEGLSRSQEMPRVGHHLIFLVLFDELREGGGLEII